MYTKELNKKLGERVGLVGKPKKRLIYLQLNTEVTFYKTESETERIMIIK